MCRGYTQDLGGAGVDEWKGSGPTGCWVHLDVQTEGQNIRKADCSAGLGGRVGAESSQFPQHRRIWRPGKKVPDVSSIPHPS